MKESDGRRIIKPLPPEALYLLDAEWAQRVNDIRWRSIGAFEHPDGRKPLGPSRTQLCRRAQAERRQFV